jgi:hypothetical protein
MDKDGFVRSFHNKGAVINNDEASLIAYRNQRKTILQYQKTNSEINNLKNEMSQLKEDISSIKELIIKALNK